MTKRTVKHTVSDSDVSAEETVEVEIVEADEPESDVEEMTVVISYPFLNLSADMLPVANEAYDNALKQGWGEGDAEAAGLRAARKWAREHNRRMPE